MSSNKFFGPSEGAGVEIELGVDGDGLVDLPSPPAMLLVLPCSVVALEGESEFLTKEFCK